MNGDLCRFQIAHFTDHDHVGVLTQERAQGFAESQPHRLIDRHLHDAFDIVFDGVLGRQQLRVDGVDPAQAGIKRGGFAATGRPGDDHNAIGPLDGLDGIIVEVLGEAKRFDLQIDGRAVQNAQHDRFAELSGQGGDAQIDHAIAHGESDAPVLWHAALGNIQVGHDLQARDDRQRQVLGRRRHFVKRAIDAVANAEFGFKRRGPERPEI